MLRRPPRHRADAPAIYVDLGDPAWNWELIQAEQDKMENPEAHPVIKYISGETRFDLNATFPVAGEMKSASMYLDPTAWRMSLRKLSYSEFYDITAIQNSTKSRERACELGLKSIDGPDAPTVKRQGSCVSPATLQTIFDEVEDGPGLILRIGNAVVLASMPLREDEKKA